MTYFNKSHLAGPGGILWWFGCEVCKSLNNITCVTVHILNCLVYLVEYVTHADIKIKIKSI